MKRSFERLFLDHPRDVGETYVEHMGASAAYGFRLLGMAGAAFVHALFPSLCRTTTSDRVCAMADEIRGRRMTASEARAARHGAYDPGL